MLLLVKFILFDKKIYYYHSGRVGVRDRYNDWAKARVRCVNGARSWRREKTMLKKEDLYL